MEDKVSKIHMATLSEDTVEQLGLQAMVDQEYAENTENPVFIGADFDSSDTCRDGEELDAAISLLKRMHQLDNGQMLVVCVDRF